MPGVQIAVGSYISDNVTINFSCMIGHDCVILPHSTLNPSVNTMGKTRIDSYSYLGVNSTIIQGLNVGVGSILGAGAVLLKNLPSYQMYAGVPAKKIKEDAFKSAVEKFIDSILRAESVGWKPTERCY